MSLLLLNGNALAIPLADESVHCVVTSPPYWNLRDYQIPGQLGLEETPAEYVDNLVAVFREVRRVLRSDGSAWINLGDSYATNPGNGRGGESPDGGIPHRSGKDKTSAGLKPKDLAGTPWRVAFALQADGWWLRSDIIWAKPNPMPESVTDRPTKSHEYLFLLTKSANYYYDADAIREKADIPAHSRPAYQVEKSRLDDGYDGHRTRLGLSEPRSFDGNRNRRTVWTIATAPYSGAHFATYPPALVEPCIKAGTSERGVCPRCKAPWDRVTERYFESLNAKRENMTGQDFFNGWSGTTNGYTHATTTGWRPTCACDAGEPVPATIFDPFAGSGTTLLVARQLGRNGIGLDLSYPYLHDQARARLSLDALEAWGEYGKKDGAAVDDLPLFRNMSLQE